MAPRGTPPPLAAVSGQEPRDAQRDVPIHPLPADDYLLFLRQTRQINWIQ